MSQWTPDEIRMLGKVVGLTAIEIRDWSRNPVVVKRYSQNDAVLQARVRRAEELAIAGRVLLELARELENSGAS